MWVQNTLNDEMKGIDRELQAAIDEVMRMLKASPGQYPGVGPVTPGPGPDNDAGLRGLVAASQPRSAVAVTAGAPASRADAQRAASPAVAAPDVRGVRHSVRIPSLQGERFVVGADTSRKLDIAMMVWLIKAPGGRVVLVDAGFYRDKFMTQWIYLDFDLVSFFLVVVNLQIYR